LLLRHRRGEKAPSLSLAEAYVSIRKFWTIFGGVFFGVGLMFLLMGLYGTYRAYGNAGRSPMRGRLPRAW
jgi:hypothetical protein